MTKAELILEAWLEGWYVFHPNRPETLYALLSPVRIKVNGIWVDGMSYQDCQDSTSEIFVRPLDEFGSFDII